jgi:hypothetical protein
MNESKDAATAKKRLTVNCDVLQNERKLATNQSAADNEQILSDVKQRRQLAPQNVANFVTFQFLNKNK